MERSFEEGGPATRGVAALGAASGVAFWIHLASLPYLLAGLWAFASWVRRGRAGFRHTIVGVAAFFAGSLPWWVRNLETGFASLRLSEASVVAPDQLAARLNALVFESLPILFGPSSFRGPHTPAWAKALLVAALVALLVEGTRGAWRGASAGERRLRQLALVLVATSTGAYLLARNTSPWEPRYLLPGLLGMLVLSGLALAEGLRRPDWRLALALVPLSFALASHWRAPRLRAFQRGTSDELRAPRLLYSKAGDLLSALRDKGVRSIYGSYWTVYRLVFLSDGALVGAPFGRIAVDRIPEMSLRAKSDPKPAFVLDGADLRDMETYLEAGGFAAERTPVGGLVIFAGLPERAVSELRAARVVPQRRGAARIGDGGRG